MLRENAFPVKWVYSLFFLLSFILYGNSIVNDYALDDNFVVTNNPYVQRGIRGIIDILENPYAKIGSSTLDFRPIVLITFAFEQSIFGANPHISHFINIVLYAVCLVLIYRTLTRIFILQHLHPWLPIIITILFAIHPVHTEVVNSLKNRDELLSMLFGFAFLLNACAFYTNKEKRRKHAIRAIIFLTLMLLSKITGIVYVGIFILAGIFHKFFKGNKWNYIFLIFCILLTFRGMYVVLVDVQRITIPFENPLDGHTSMSVILGTSMKILLYHLKMLVFPDTLRFYYGYNMFPLNRMSDPWAILSLVFHVCLLGDGIYRFYKRDVLGFLVLCYFGAIVLYANFPVPYTGMFSERALLLSSLWFTAMVCVTVRRVMNHYGIHLRKKEMEYAAITFAIVLFTALSWRTIRRNFDWKNNLVLMAHDMPSLKNSVMANYMYANNLRYQASNSTDTSYSSTLGRKAIEYYNKTIELFPGYPEMYYRKASTYRYNLNDLKGAERELMEAIKYDSLYFNANFELAKLYYDLQIMDKSYAYFGKAYSIKPSDSLTLFYYGQVASAVKDMPTTYQVNKKFIELYPNLQYPYLNMGKYYSQMMKDDTAVIYFDKAVALGSRNPELLKQLAIYYEEKDRKKADYYRKILNSKF